VARPGRGRRSGLRRVLGRPPSVEVAIEEDQIVIRRAGGSDSDEDDDNGDGDGHGHGDGDGDDKGD